MTAITRDEFETVKELLASAARYAESAHRGLDRLEASQQRSQTQIDQLSVKIDQLTEAQRGTGEQIHQLTEAQRRTDQQIDQLTLKIDRLADGQQRTDQRLEVFIFESQRLMGGHAERITKLEGISERLEAILSYLVRKEGPGE